MEQAIRELQEAIATVHERVACRRCGAGLGQECRHLIRGTKLKGPHAERVRDGGIAVR